MIDEDYKYHCLGGALCPNGPSTWYVTDWDQRRTVSVTMDGEVEDDNIAIEHFRLHGNQLSPGIYEINVSNTGEIISTSTDPEDDQNFCVHYPFLHEMSLPEGIQTVRRDELEELDRLGPMTDLVAYPPCAGGTAKKVVFKYHFVFQRAEMTWIEMNLWMRLPHHPNIVPFDRIVVDELEGRVVGFTNLYVPGGTLEENKSRVFRLEWLRQLIKVVDDLNLRYSIAHQDIAPRNLLVDGSTDSIKLFDFNFASRIHHKSILGDREHYDKARNDVKGVIFTIYEIITRDDSLRRKRHEEQNLDDIRREWVKHPEVKLDHPVTSYQLMLQEWEKQRARDHLGDCPEPINWPTRPKPPKKTSTTKDPWGKLHVNTWDAVSERRQDVRDRGGKVLTWERPPQRLIDSGTRVLSTGEVIKC
ncbi:hypothetical protein F4805DRAFT_413543 [Annulohypoxylon moriforme]|nr:hypothetical protein F4805DRAFT_413543 [Annulohypoxylon moriforme]